jgi:PiT family inorganic phosphate transporter
MLTPTLFLAIAVGFYAAWNIGANDVANSMGTSVGSGAITLKQAVLFAAIFEFAGAVLVGTHVTDTVRKGILDPLTFSAAPSLFACGMLASLIATALGRQHHGKLGSLTTVRRHLRFRSL